MKWRMVTLIPSQTWNIATQFITFRLQVQEWRKWKRYSGCEIQLSIMQRELWWWKVGRVVILMWKWMERRSNCFCWEKYWDQYLIGRHQGFNLCFVVFLLIGNTARDFFTASTFLNEKITKNTTLQWRIDTRTLLPPLQFFWKSPSFFP